MKTTDTKPTTDRDEGRLLISALLACWLVFWALCLASCAVSMVHAESVAWWLVTFWGWLGCLTMLGIGGRWVAEFVTPVNR